MNQPDQTQVNTGSPAPVDVSGTNADATRTVARSGPPQPTVLDDPGRTDAVVSVAQQYELVRQLGRGTFGEVWLARKNPSGIEKAVKVLHQAADQDTAKRELKSLELIKNLRHPYLLATEDFWVGGNKLYIVTELADGTLRGRMKECVAEGKPGIPPDELLVYLRESAEGLDYLHQNQITHRDVKPDNILFHPDGFAKLADLGLAKRLNDDSGLTAVSQGVGTSYYMPYEQALNGSLVDARSDVFALGATLYHLLTGQVPFPGATHEEVVRGKEAGRFVPVRSTNPEVPPAVASILETALHRDPRSRFPTADELAAALDATGLATRLPAIAPGEIPPGDGQPVDAPTRVDFTAGPSLAAGSCP